MSNITLRFTSFNTESCCDFVTINRCTSADCSTKEQVVRLSGSAVSNDTVYSSSTGFLQVEFVTDSSVTRSGFRAEWQSTAATETRDLGGGASTLSEVLESLLASDSAQSSAQLRRNSHTGRAVKSTGRSFGGFPATVAEMSGIASAALTKMTTVFSEPLRAAFNARSDVRQKPAHGTRADNFITGSITEQLSERLVSRKLLWTRAQSLARRALGGSAEGVLGSAEGGFALASHAWKQEEECPDGEVRCPDGQCGCIDLDDLDTSMFNVLRELGLYDEQDTAPGCLPFSTLVAEARAFTQVFFPASPVAQDPSYNFCVPDPAHNADVAAFLNNTWGIHWDDDNCSAFDSSARAKQAPCLRFPLSAWDGVLPGGESVFSADRLTGRLFLENSLHPPAAADKMLPLLGITCDGSMFFNLGDKLGGGAAMPGMRRVFDFVMGRVMAIQTCRAKERNPKFVFSRADFLKHFAVFAPVSWLSVLTKPPTGKEFDVFSNMTNAWSGVALGMSTVVQKLLGEALGLSTSASEPGSLHSNHGNESLDRPYMPCTSDADCNYDQCSNITCPRDNVACPAGHANGFWPAECIYKSSRWHHPDIIPNGTRICRAIRAPEAQACPCPAGLSPDACGECGGDGSTCSSDASHRLDMSGLHSCTAADYAQQGCFAEMNVKDVLQMSMESTLMVGIKQCFSSTSAVPFPAVSIALKGDVVDALSPLRTCEQNSDCPLEYTCTADVTPELTTGRGDDAGFPDLFDELIFGGSTDEVRRNKCVCVLSHEQVHFLVHATCSR